MPEPVDGAASPPEVIWCDFGGVLTSSVTDAFERMVAAAGVPGPVLREAIDQVAAGWNMHSLDPLERGLLSQHEWGTQVTRALGPAWTPRIDLTRFGEHWYTGRTLESSLLDFLVRARRAGLRVGLLTNSVAEWEPLRRALLPDWSTFEVIINSHEVGMRKPEAGIFDLAERAFRVSGSGCVLVDDLAVNCAAARERGWAAIEHRSVADTLAALAAMTGVPALRTATR
jgi:putative hydrolase of the HAD superfamily